MGLGHELAESSKARVPGLFDSQAGRSLGQVKTVEYSKKAAEEERAEAASTKAKMGDWMNSPSTDSSSDVLWRIKKRGLKERETLVRRGARARSVGSQLKLINGSCSFLS